MVLHAQLASQTYALKFDELACVAPVAKMTPTQTPLLSLSEATEPISSV